ncbi:hypothetical protein [Sphingopyxis macrogoltabida]|uniref:hypothetical protein n=1 Tax=Sphingopyxis macrogoltabida TaxID=33050 RepID=UPI0011AB585D|nr:hypothetical protein [Sphingopyxis macrogoltabida]
MPTDLRVTLADFTAQESEWLEINGWTNSGPLGDARAAITQSFIGADRDATIAGTANSPAMENVFAPLPTDPGQIRLRQAVDGCANYAFKVEWGAGCASEGPVTISVAAPGIVTWPGGHGLAAGSPVIFEPEGGNLPTGLTAGTVYYVRETGLTPTSFSVSATPGGAGITTTLAATADEIIATAQPAGETDLFYGIVLSKSKNGGEANAARMATHSIKPNTNIVEV